MYRLLALALPLFWLLFPTPVHAANPVRSEVTAVYTYTPTGESQVKEDISLTNLESQYYVTSYQIDLSGLTTGNIVAANEKGLLPVVSEKIAEGHTRVTVTFTEPVVGKNQTRKFSLSYSGQPAVKKGQVWELIIPKAKNPSQYDSYTLILRIPTSFGQLAYMLPASSDPPLSSPDFSTYTITGTQNGLVAAFGKFQSFSFRLKYTLSNSTPKTEVSQIALPPDTDYQQVFYDDILPRPDAITVDPDGNWLASFTVPASSQLQISASGQAHILAHPFPRAGAPAPEIPDNLLASNSIWTASDPAVAQLGRQLQTPENIYRYVTSTLKFNFDRLNTPPQRLGAANSLKHPENSLCQEFTDLFIALARSAGIPAREVEGFAYTTDARLTPTSFFDVLHAWPQYWDAVGKTWVSVDPTWGNTSGGVDYFHAFDFNHFAFVIHGQDPLSPLPAGLYDSGGPSRDVDVSLATFREPVIQPLTMSLRSAAAIFPFIPTSSHIQLENPNGHALYNTQLQFTSTNVNLQNPPQNRPFTLLPFARISLPLKLTSGVLPRFSSHQITVSTSADHSITYNIKESAFYLWYGIFTTIISAALIFLAVLAHRAWSIYIQRHGRGSPLRR